MDAPHSPRTCRWAQPAVFVPVPGWIALWQYSWSCLGDDGSRTVLDARAECGRCVRWAERPGQDEAWILAQAAV